MSEHIFKGKDAETKEWVEGYLWSERTIGVTSPCGNVDEVVVDPDTVCQYIGRTDSTGEKIFENDIISIKSKNEEIFRLIVKFGVCGGVKNTPHEVGYIGFYLSAHNDSTNPCIELRKDIVYWLNAYHCEVVGSIFDEMGVEE